MFDKDYIIGLLSNGKRTDGRGLDEYRKITIETNKMVNPEGWASVKLGDTHVMAGVKMDVGQPFPDKPNEGVLMTSAEFSPIASPDFEKGPPDEHAIELARVVDRGIRESKTIDMEKLCIKEGELVWMIHVDIHILNHDGNLVDAAALAAIAALQNTRFPEYKDEKINYEKKTEKLKLKYKPIAVTIFKFKDKIIIDPNALEEGVIDGALVVTTKDDGNICALQKLGSAGFTKEEIEKILELGIKKGKELRKLI
jgi:exosome complex component RRP42